MTLENPVNTKETVEEVNKLLDKLADYKKLVEDFDEQETLKNQNSSDFNKDQYHILKGRMEEGGHIESLEHVYNKLENTPELIITNMEFPVGHDLIKVLPGDIGALFKKQYYDGQADAEMITMAEARKMIEDYEKGLNQTLELIRTIKIGTEF